MKIFLCLVAIVCGSGVLVPDTRTESLNTKPDCIGPEKSGTISCDPPIDEIFCSSDCVSSGDFCKEAGTVDSIALFEEVIMSSGTSTLVDVYSSCDPAIVSNQCRPSTTVNTINCYKSTECICEYVAGNRVCVYGEETVYYLIVYRPKTNGPGCPIEAPPGEIDE